jgi:hypothetical protein
VGGTPTPECPGQSAQLLVQGATSVRVNLAGSPDSTYDIQEAINLGPVLVEAEARPSPRLGVEHEQEWRVVGAVGREAPQLVA